MVFIVVPDNVDKHVVTFANVVVPLTFKDDKWVDKPWNVVVPLTFNDDTQVELFCKVVLPVTYKVPNAVLLNNVVDVALRLDILNVEFVDNEFKLLNIVVDVAFKLDIFNLPTIPNFNNAATFLSQ